MGYPLKKGRDWEKWKNFYNQKASFNAVIKRGSYLSNYYKLKMPLDKMHAQKREPLNINIAIFLPEKIEIKTPLYFKRLFL